MIQGHHVVLFFYGLILFCAGGAVLQRWLSRHD